jgi:chromosome segregation ATPase
MMIWKKLNSVSESDKNVAISHIQERLATVEKTNAELEARVSTLEKKLRGIEDIVQELEHNFKSVDEDVTFIREISQSLLEKLKRTDIMIYNSATKAELLDIVEAISTSLASIRNKMTLPF